MTKRYRRHTGAVLSLLLALPLLAGCGTSDVPAATPWPVPTAGSEPTGTPAATIPMPDLGPSPAPVPLTDATKEALRLANLDAQWQSVVASFPEAVRPEVGSFDYLAPAARAAALAPCYADAGVEFSEGSDESGTVIGLSASITDQADATAIYLCDAAYPTQPVAPPSPEILGYLYDYFTEFVVPCYEANGIDNPPAPSREDYVALWPNQNWYPSMGIDPDSPEGVAIEEACPQPPQ